METLPHQPNQPTPTPLVFSMQGENQEESSFDFWGILNRRKWLVFLGLVTGMALGALYHAQCETIYASSARVKIEPKDPLYIAMSNSPGSYMGQTASDLGVRHDQFIVQPNIINT
ncbi:MAG: hypothetical protein P8J27_08045, partial [Mariniblastus sp.]|nr:hypothetical protein [Mariniblastus sp.]